MPPKRSVSAYLGKSGPDFKKEKKKVGKKLKPENERKGSATVTTKGIVLKQQLQARELKDYLARLSHHNANTRIQAIKDLADQWGELQHSSDASLVCQQIAALHRDQDEDARDEALAFWGKAFKDCSDSVFENAIASIIVHICAATTDLDAGVRSHALRALLLWVETKPQLVLPYRSKLIELLSDMVLTAAKGQNTLRSRKVLLRIFSILHRLACRMHASSKSSDTALSLYMKSIPLWEASGQSSHAGNSSIHQPKLFGAVAFIAAEALPDFGELDSDSSAADLELACSMAEVVSACACEGQDNVDSERAQRQFLESYPYALACRTQGERLVLKLNILLSSTVLVLHDAESVQDDVCAVLMFAAGAPLDSSTFDLLMAACRHLTAAAPGTCQGVIHTLLKTHADSAARMEKTLQLLQDTMEAGVDMSTQMHKWLLKSSSSLLWKFGHEGAHGTCVLLLHVLRRWLLQNPEKGDAFSSKFGTFFSAPTKTKDVLGPFAAASQEAQKLALHVVALFPLTQLLSQRIGVCIQSVPADTQMMILEAVAQHNDVQVAGPSLLTLLALALVTPEEESPLPAEKKPVVEACARHMCNMTLRPGALSRPDLISLVTDILLRRGNRPWLSQALRCCLETMKHPEQ